MSSRTLIVALLILAAVLALLPQVIGRTRRLQSMRADLTEVLTECRDRYAAAKTSADSAAVDEWHPTLHGEARPGDPPCGPYRRRNMLERTRP
jgi:hypothetical protein